MAGKVTTGKVGKRYHVLSFRVTTDELLLIKHAKRRRKISKFLRDIVIPALPAPHPVGAAASDHATGVCNG